MDVGTVVGEHFFTSHSKGSDTGSILFINALVVKYEEAEIPTCLDGTVRTGKHSRNIGDGFASLYHVALCTSPYLDIVRVMRVTNLYALEVVNPVVHHFAEVFFCTLHRTVIELQRLVGIADFGHSGHMCHVNQSLGGSLLPAVCTCRGYGHTRILKVGGKHQIFAVIVYHGIVRALFIDTVDENVEKAAHRLFDAYQPVAQDFHAVIFRLAEDLDVIQAVGRRKVADDFQCRERLIVHRIGGFLKQT